ncbi:tetratricopeptide repeat protein [Fidelibacter multiformis]|uniref:tetratricopeptide repeat protein n=1 Tax=Fidelibacter multiformis TaxID=3377529 RepID=UPI0037DD2C70
MRHLSFFIVTTVILLSIQFTGCEKRSTSLYDRYAGWIHTSKEEKLLRRIDDLTLEIQQQGEASPEALKNLMDLSRLGTEMGDAHRAFEAGLRAQSMAEVLYGPKDEKTIRVYIQLADFAMTLGEPRLAKNYLDKGMTAAAMAHHGNYLLLADIYSRYAEVNQAFQRMDDAEALYFKAIGLVEKADSNHVMIADIEARLGMLKESQEKYETAEKFYRKALATVDKLRGTNSLQSASLHNNLASVCFMTNRPEEAITHLEKSLKIWKEEKDSHIKQAEIHSNLAEIYRAVQDMDKAEKEYKILLKLMEDIPETTPLYPALLLNLSHYYTQLDQKEKAETFKAKAREIQKILQNQYLENVSTLETKFKRIPGMEIK